MIDIPVGLYTIRTSKSLNVVRDKYGQDGVCHSMIGPNHVVIFTSYVAAGRAAAIGLELGDAAEMTLVISGCMHLKA